MDDNKVSAMPPLKELIETNLEPKQWLIYYRNVWKRNLIARTIDMQSDTTRKEANPEDQVIMDDGSHRPTTVKERLESRKILIQDALEILSSIEKLLEVCEKQKGEFEKTYWSDEAMKVAEDMIPKKEENKEVEAKPEAGDEAKV